METLLPDEIWNERLFTGSCEAGAAEELQAVTENTAQRIHRQNDEIQMAATAVIAERITDINGTNLVIGSAAEEQAQVVREVDRNLVAISDISKQSTDGVQQTSVASEELARLAANLNNLVNRFSMEPLTLPIQSAITRQTVLDRRQRLNLAAVEPTIQ